MTFQPFRRAALAAGLVVCLAAPAHAMVFDLSFLGGTSTAAIAAFQTAADAWSTLLADPVTVSLTLGTSGSLGSGVLASTNTSDVNYSYAAVAAALASDATSATDATVVAHLPPGSSVPLLINYTADNPNGAGSAIPYVDTTGANNSTIHMTTANARALGLAAAPTALGGCIGPCDGAITFSTGYSYDYDPSDGITPGAFDFIGLAEHEIGHALGFKSGVDVLDRNAPNGTTYYNANSFDDLSPLDLFRCSAATLGSNVRDFTAGTAAKFFSIDGCQTADLGGSFSTGVNHGDGNQASHWKDGASLGVMDPTANAGEHLTISPLDLTAFDAIGWNLTGVPEPASFALLGTALIGFAGLRRRRFRRG